MLGLINKTHKIKTSARKKCAYKLILMKRPSIVYLRGRHVINPGRRVREKKRAAGLDLNGREVKRKIKQAATGNAAESCRGLNNIFDHH